MNKQASPLISIITIVKNQEQYIESCINSVIEQTYQNIEYIIIDGQSTDNTIEIIKKYQKYISFWISEPDSGISDAMNKGIKHSKGKFILFLHADDYLISANCIEKNITQFQQEIDILAFSILFETPTHKKLKKSQWNVSFYIKNKIFHQGVFCQRQLFEKIGYFDIKLKIAMDYDFFLRAYQQPTTIKILNEPLSVMRDTGISSRQDWKSLQARFTEERKIHFKYCKTIFGKLFYHLYWLLYLPYRFGVYLLKK